MNGAHATIAGLARQFGVPARVVHLALASTIASAATASSVAYLDGDWVSGGALTNDTITVAKGASANVSYGTSHLGRIPVTHDGDGDKVHGVTISVGTDAAATANSGGQVRVSVAGIMSDGQPYQRTVTTGDEVTIPIGLAVSANLILTITNLTDGTSGQDLNVSFSGGTVPLADPDAIIMASVLGAGLDEDLDVDEAARKSMDIDDEDDEDDDDEFMTRAEVAELISRTLASAAAADKSPRGAGMRKALHIGAKLAKSKKVQKAAKAAGQQVAKAAGKRKGKRRNAKRKGKGKGKGKR
jgi:hypothetical protein